MTKNNPAVNLKQLFLALQEELKARLKTSRSFSHPGTKGDATEIDWVSMLRTHLPARYQVGKAFVMDSKGAISDQIDVVIYDRQYCPFLFTKNGQHYIPAESVYAVFEVKQELNREHISYAGKKIASVRTLFRTSAPVPSASGMLPAVKPFEILGGILTLQSSWSPPFGESFKSALGELNTLQQINLGCALIHGTFKVNYEGAKTAATISTEETALINFFLSLLTLLQAKATVPAIDWNEYTESL
ncbi:MAG TPA: hypothetical protein PKA76_15385 [Pirellulaceae bacterium]|nr:hypothetical protein [Pyrinomonadaceae bacterium]HMP65566.1 hypothetical protein [Pyrinomonadaceae bacterium]HMP70728.1 hypothetical protein [Pirellulaceae bacterium]